MQFLLFFVVVSTVGVVAILLRNRKPVSMESSIDEFDRRLRALAPEEQADRRADPHESGASGPG